MSLTSTGEVFSLDGFEAALNSERLWNPQTGIFRSVPYGRNLFCGGHIQLADGRTLFVGGHIAAYEGLADTTLFNAQTNTYFRGADMAEPRWYPTATQLPDGRCSSSPATGSCRTGPGAPHAFADASVNSLPEVYNPADEHVDEPDERAADLAALSAACSCSRTGGSSTSAPTRRRAS